MSIQLASGLRVLERPLSPATTACLTAAGIHPVLASLYAARGITQAQDVTADHTNLVPYSSLKNCAEMAVILADAIQAKQKLLIISDYDADGATGCAVGLRALRSFNANVDYLIPNRIEHGYGLTPEIVRVAAETKGPDFIITVDNGISSNEGVSLANTLGIRVLVTDHHLPPAVLPPAECIVNPNQPDDAFPSKHLAGVGVMFYVMWALRDELIRRGVPDLPKVSTLLPIVALGTVADVVPLDRNNRILVGIGLERIRQGRSFVGIDQLILVANRAKSRMSTSDFGFSLGPRLNAAGRLESMDAGVELLTTDNPAKAESLAKSLNELNSKRKGIEAKITEEAVDKIIATVNPAEAYSIVVADTAWAQGVIGIAASRLKEAYNRPTIIFAINENGVGKGSGRSIPGLNIRDALVLVDSRCPGLLLKFGGHAMAAGATLRAGAFDEFKKLFEIVVREMLESNKEVLDRVVVTDGSLTNENITVTTAQLLEDGIWGQQFPEPLFNGTFQVKFTKQMGTEGQHTSFVLEHDGMEIKAVKFNNYAIFSGTIFCTYRLAVNEFRGNASVQLMLGHVEQM